MTKSEILSIIRNNILEIIGDINPDAIQPEISMKDLGANSIDRVDVVIKTMAELGLKIPLVDFASVNNIGDLVDLFYQKSQNKEETV